MRTKDKLTKPKHDKGGSVDGGGSLKESPNPMRQFRIPTDPFLQLGLHGLPLCGKLNII